jgi:polysaccharide biosynthesis/export protein
MHLRGLMNTRHAVAAAFLVVGLFAGVGAAQAQQPTSGAASAQSAADVTLRPGDALRITIWPNAELGGEFVVEEDGNVYLPLLEGVRAEGVSIQQLREQLRRGYGEAMQNPVVSVTPLYHVTITGEVQRPGIHQITSAHSLFDVIGMAGGFRERADPENVRVVRRGEVVEFDALRALETGEGMDAIRLRSGDHIVVPAERPPRVNWSTVFTVVRTVSTTLLLWDRFLRD